MVVLDEHLGSAEYEDMELCEFYEFLVRLAYTAPVQWTEEDIAHGKNEETEGQSKMMIDQKMRRLLIKMLKVIDCEFIEPAEKIKW